MNDQAIKLRSLMRNASRRPAASALHGRCRDNYRSGLHVAAVCGAKAGVGVTTTVHSLAAAYQRAGHRTAVLDFSGWASKHDAPAGAGLHEVLTGQTSWEEVLYSCEENIYLLGKSSAAPDDARRQAVGERDLADKLQDLAAWVDVCLLDLGANSHAVLPDCWEFAQEVLLVTTPECLAIMDAYAAIKALGPRTGAATLRVVVNQASERQRKAVGQRLQRTCSRFLNLRIDEVLAAPTDACLPSAVTADALHVSEPLAARLNAGVMRGVGKQKFATLAKIK